MTPFKYARAGSPTEAVGPAGIQAARYLGGGTNLVDLMRETIEQPFILPTRSACRADNMLLEVRHVELDVLSNIFMRAPGESVGSFALESAMDELAEALGIDPITLRIRNEPEKDPLSGLPFSARHIVQPWHDGAARLGWQRRNPVPRSTLEGDWWIGMGCAMATYPYYRMPGAAARLTLTRAGTATVQTQVAAEELGLDMTQVHFQYGDSTLPGLVMAGGSQQTAAVSAAILAACTALKKELLAVVGNSSPLAGLTLAEIGCRDAGLHRPAVEWIAAALSGLLVLCLVVFLGNEALSDGAHPADLLVTIERVEQVENGTIVTVAVVNRGDRAVAAVTVDASVKPATTPGKQIAFDYIAARAIRRGAFLFPHPVTPSALDIQVGGYTEL